MSYAQKLVDFYCYRCRGYELKTSPHYRAQKQRLARRRRAEREKAEEQQSHFLGYDKQAR